MSSDHAHPAPDTPSETEESESPDRGFFGRFFEAFSGSEDDDSTEEELAAGEKTGPGLLNLSRMRVEDVAIPSVEIVSVPIDIGFDDLVEIFRRTGLTRLPVYAGTLDHPRGMIHLKDFALRHGFGQRTDFNLSDTLRPLIYAPPSMPIGVLLQRMQSERTHMALVIDEYGGVDGLVTIEDLIEQVIGQIEDEHDEDEDQLFVEEKPGVWLAQARTPLDEFKRRVQMNLTAPDEDEEIDTLGGRRRRANRSAAGQGRGDPASLRRGVRDRRCRSAKIETAARSPSRA